MICQHCGREFELGTCYWKRYCQKTCKSRAKYRRLIERQPDYHIKQKAYTYCWWVQQKKLNARIGGKQDASPVTQVQAENTGPGR